MATSLIYCKKICNWSYSNRISNLNLIKNIRYIHDNTNFENCTQVSSHIDFVSSVNLSVSESIDGIDYMVTDRTGSQNFWASFIDVIKKKQVHRRQQQIVLFA